jgi:hypothetical protein
MGSKESGEVHISRGESVEHELNRLIEKRDERRRVEDGERPAEEMWRESERKYAARRREENAAAWAEYHRSQAARHRATLQDLIAHHEQAAVQLMENGEERETA